MADKPRLGFDSETTDTDSFAKNTTLIVVFHFQTIATVRLDHFRRHHCRGRDALWCRRLRPLSGLLTSAYRTLVVSLNLRSF